MTEHEYETEQLLRACAMKGSLEDRGRAAVTLADFYEERGQLSRAALWRDLARDPDHEHPDLLTRSSHVHAVDLRRNAMIWLLHHTLSVRELAKLFGLSPTRAAQIIAQGDCDIWEHAIEERHQPTLAASCRLAKVGALDGLGYRPSFGDLPPESWPARRTERKRSRKAKP